MKALLLIAFVFITTAAHAVPKYNARTSSCQDLQDAVENYGEIAVRAKNFLIANTIYVSANPRCHALAYKKEARFRTADSVSCQVGFTCEEDRTLRGDCFPGNNPSLSRCN